MLHLHPAGASCNLVGFSQDSSHDAHAPVAGFAGADLQALCTGAVMAALRRSSPEVLLDPRLEKGMPLNMASETEAVTHPGDQEPQQQHDSLQKSQHASSAAGAAGAAGALPSFNNREQQPPHSVQNAQQIDDTFTARGSTARYDAGAADPPQALERPSMSSGPEQGTRPQLSDHDSLQADTGVPPHVLGSSTGPEDPLNRPQPFTAPAQSHRPVQHADAGKAPAVHPASRPIRGAPSALEGLEVRACDWREALVAAPEACARRESMAAMSASAAQALPARLGPALLPMCSLALQVHCSAKASDIHA